MGRNGFHGIDCLALALALALVLVGCLVAESAAAQCYDRPAWRGSGYNWNGGRGGYYEPWYTYRYRSWEYRPRRWEWD